MNAFTRFLTKEGNDFKSCPYCKCKNLKRKGGDIVYCDGASLVTLAKTECIECLDCKSVLVYAPEGVTNRKEWQEFIKKEIEGG